MKIYLLSILLCVLLFSCRLDSQNNDETVKKTIYFPSNGKVKTIENFKNGVKSGRCYEYYESGNLFKISEYENDTLNGKIIVFDDKSGFFISAVEKYKMGALDGLCCYFSNSRIEKKINFRAGRRIGDSYLYDADRNVISYNSSDLEEKTFYVEGIDENGEYARIGRFISDKILVNNKHETNFILKSGVESNLIFVVANSPSIKLSYMLDADIREGATIMESKFKSFIPINGLLFVNLTYKDTGYHYIRLRAVVKSSKVFKDVKNEIVDFRIRCVR